jgi:hypothetical protein
MAETHRNTAYKYTPSSARSTRQILDSTSISTSSPSQSTASDPSELSFRPQNYTRKSSNYAEADAHARAALAESSSNTNTAPENVGGDDIGKGEENTANAGRGTGGVGWKPRYGRMQSWNQQDMKRELQMSGVMPEGLGDLPGFSEGKK